MRYTLSLSAPMEAQLGAAVALGLLDSTGRPLTRSSALLSAICLGLPRLAASNGNLPTVAFSVPAPPLPRSAPPLVASPSASSPPGDDEELPDNFPVRDASHARELGLLGIPVHPAPPAVFTPPPPMAVPDESTARRQRVLARRAALAEMRSGDFIPDILLTEEQKQARAEVEQAGGKRQFLFSAASRRAVEAQLAAEEAELGLGEEVGRG